MVGEFPPAAGCVVGMSLLDGAPGRPFIAGALPPGRNRAGPLSNPPPRITMKLPLASGTAAALCLVLASCYPYQENPKNKKANQPPQPTPLTQQEKAKQEEEKKRKQQEEELKQQQSATPSTPAETPPQNTTPSETPKPPVEEKRADYAFANKVPGKDGFVFSPYNNKVVDVRDIPSGTLVQDPTYPASEKKYFRVP
jgi:hypothetical protein